MFCFFLFFFSSRRRHTRSLRDWSSDVCSSDLRCPCLLFYNRSVVPCQEQANLLPPQEEKQAVNRSEERRVGKSVDLGGRRIIKKKKKITRMYIEMARSKK